MFGNYKKTYIKRDNIINIFFGISKKNLNNKVNIEMINSFYFK